MPKRTEKKHILQVYLCGSSFSQVTGSHNTNWEIQHSSKAPVNWLKEFINLTDHGKYHAAAAGMSLNKYMHTTSPNYEKHSTRNKNHDR